MVKILDLSALVVNYKLPTYENHPFLSRPRNPTRIGRFDMI
jgi:hypothetical protein